MASQQRARIVRGCEACRAAHAKCDNQLPSCSRCTLLNRECVRVASDPFRHAYNPTVKPVDRALGPRPEYEYAEDQVWLTPRSNVVEFVYEDPSDEQSPFQVTDSGIISPHMSATEDLHVSPSGNLQDRYTSSAIYPATGEPPRPSPPSYGSLGVASVGARSGNNASGSPSTGESEWIQNADTWQSEHSNDNTQEEHRDVSAETAHTGSFSGCLPLSPHTPGTSRRRHWPLTDENEALLLRHFVAKLSLWFDYCDPRNTFATSVVQQAVNSPTLLYAILATSARHLSMTSDFDAYLADKYHRECLALLIDIVGDNSALLDEALCAATVILRLFEEISVPLVGSDTQGHLMGTHTFMRTPEYQPSGIREAAFRVVLRQEIVFAFKTQTPLQLLPEYVQVDRAMDTADDWGSAFHIMVLCAEVLSYCYGEEQNLAETWDDLSERVRSWMESKPASFEPLFCVPAGVQENQVFPQIWLLNDCHVAAHQHYLMCQILLVSHDPRKPQLGPKRTEALESSERVIRDHVKDICGIALSNNHCIPAMFTASMVISVCGEFFIDYQDQKSMMEILVKTDVELAWPTASAQTYLLEKWNWGHA